MQSADPRRVDDASYVGLSGLAFGRLPAMIAGFVATFTVLTLLDAVRAFGRRAL
jgi:hypothetical protein